MLPLVLLFICFAYGDVTVTNHWHSVKHESKLIPTFQVVLNPLVQRGSSIHDNVWKYVGLLDN